MKIVHALRQYLFITIILSLTMHTYGQGPVKNYSTEWKKVDELIGKGLSKDALEQVKKIYGLAKKEKQDAQLIKAAVYMTQLQTENRENNAVASIKELEQEAAAGTGPARSILTSLVASEYYAYYQTVRWQLYDRTATVTFDKADIATWGTEDFHQKIGALFLESIQDEAVLKTTRLENFDAIITKGNMRKLRPTLFDLLAFRALEYFSSDERNIKKPAYAFEINTASAFDPAADFIHRKFETKDSASLEHRALLLYQKLIAFHLEDKDPAALIDTDLARFQYVRQKSVHQDKDELYFMAVNHIADQYQSTPAAAQAWYLKAAHLNEEAENFRTGKDSASRFKRVKALEILRQIIRDNPETEGGVNAFNLSKTITRKSLSLSVEAVNSIAKPFRVLVKYRDLDKLYFRVIRVSESLRKILENDEQNTKWKIFAGSQAVKSWEQPLPDTKDFQEHAVEIKADGLPSGEYILLGSSDTGFQRANAVLGATIFHVSDISYIQRGDDLFVLNRETGEPLPGAKVQLWEKRYDYNIRSNVKTKGTLLTTDQRGYFKKPPIKRTNYGRQSVLEITYQNDRLFVQDNTGQYYYSEEGETAESEKVIEETYLFTDRSLYRPGQTVYYKGIVRNGDAVSRNQQEEFAVVLYNANAEHVAESKHRVNAYGSFSGSFTIPGNGLTGNFYILVRDKSRVDFQVAEYKRPRFSVEFDTLKATYKVSDHIKVSGKAIAYAGNTIDAATVRYRVVRTPRLLYTWLLRHWWMPDEPMEIAHGETITDVSGQFQVDFEAIPDRKVDIKLDPVFDYTIYADVTDSNGETRSSETRISVSYKSYILKADIPAVTEAGQFKSLAIRTENLAGVFAPAEATIQITRITSENRLIRKRYWERPDLFVMSKNEFVASFPYDEYDRETEMENWEAVAGSSVSKKAALQADSPVPVSEFDLPAGFYKIEISTTNAAGEKLMDVKFTELKDMGAKKLSYPQYLASTPATAAEPGEKGVYTLGTSAENLFVIASTNRKSAGAGFSRLTLNDELKRFDYSPSENDRGGYSVDYVFVKHNRIHTHIENIVVPWSNKDLKIEYATFRDKTLPGSKETWKVKISGYQKEKVAAEMLGSMYDASLDQFYPHQWQKPDIWPVRTGLGNWKDSGNFGIANADVRNNDPGDFKYFEKRYDELIGSANRIRRQRNRLLLRGGAGGKAGVSMEMAVPQAAPMAMDEEVSYSMVQSDAKVYKKTKPAEAEKLKETAPGDKQPTQGPVIRTNFNETAFFLPDLKTDSEGNITFSFTMPEALTRWRFQALVHTPELAMGYSSKEIVTQKDLMVQPNAPRFLREGDRISFPVKVANLSSATLNGDVSLLLLDSETGEPLDKLFKNETSSSQFSVAAGQSSTTFFTLEIPKGFTKMITWRAVAKAGNLSDGEENVLPILPNRMLVTESMPISATGGGTKHFTFEKLLGSAKSTTLAHQSITVEYSSNPAWYAVQSLPYLMEYPYECAEQTWNRYYANTLASHIVSASPRIAQVFKLWKDTGALQSNLSKNQELKSLLLQETPWVLASKTEEEQQRNVALLFDLARMENELNASMLKLQEMQSSNGGFVWFKGGPDDRYITQYIVTGIGHLQKIKAFQPAQQKGIDAILEKAVPYLDKRIQEDYNNLVKYKTDLKSYVPGPVELQYLYARSFFNRPVPAASQKAYQYYRDRARLTWVSQSKLLQGMTALVAQRTQDSKTANQILESLRQSAIHDEELGMYWKTSQRGWWWHEAPIERQALLIEAFQEIGNDRPTVAALKTWLLKNKQTNSWKSTKATAEACYALLMTGSDWISETIRTTIRLGDTEIRQEGDNAKNGTGYFKKTVDSGIAATMANVALHVEGKSASGIPQAPGWGSVYWQYFEDLDKITFAETPLKLSKQLFVETNSDKGPVLTPVREGEAVKVGDKIKVRIELRVDRDMEYVHMKDMRASGLEPVNVLSGYRWQGGLGYYESTRDASTNFFFNALRKGTYVFEYPLFITHEGDFSNGITTIQCMYAPEFTAHSEGIRLKALPRK